MSRTRPRRDVPNRGTVARKRDCSSGVFSAEEIAKRVLYEDNHLLALNKPVGLATMGVSSDEVSLFSLAKEYIKEKYQKPGGVYLGVVSRLDLPVSGVVVFARTSKAASRLCEQFGSRSVTKIYRALVEGDLRPDEGELVDYICEDKNARKLWITESPSVSSRNIDVKEARLRYKVIERFSSTTFVEAHLLTGRKHQIRLQFSHCGTPIVGDGKYGAKPISQMGVCLHAYQLTIAHPTTKTPLTFLAPVPDWSRWI